jgi:hypothetical protein
MPISYLTDMQCALTDEARAAAGCDGRMANTGRAPGRCCVCRAFSLEVAQLVVGLQAVEAAALRGFPCKAHPVGLAQADENQKRLPEDGAAGLHLLELVDGRACVAQGGSIRVDEMPNNGVWHQGTAVAGMHGARWVKLD